MKVKDAMHKGVDWVSPDTPLTELAKLMREHDIGAIPIGENDRLIGMVTDRDIVCKGLAEDSFDARRATARDVMTPGIHTGGPQPFGAQRSADRMRQERFCPSSLKQTRRRLSAVDLLRDWRSSACRQYLPSEALHRMVIKAEQLQVTIGSMHPPTT